MRGLPGFCPWRQLQPGGAQQGCPPLGGGALPAACSEWEEGKLCMCRRSTELCRPHHCSEDPQRHKGPTLRQQCCEGPCRGEAGEATAPSADSSSVGWVGPWSGLLQRGLFRGEGEMPMPVLATPLPLWSGCSALVRFLPLWWASAWPSASRGQLQPRGLATPQALLVWCSRRCCPAALPA